MSDSSTFLDGNTYILPLHKADLAKIKEDLTITTVDYNERKHIARLFLVDSARGTISLPRLYGIRNYGLPSAVRMADGNSLEAKLGKDDVKKYKLLDYQEKCMKYMKDNHYTKGQLAEGSAGCICDLPCGRGKTPMGVDFTFFAKRRTLVVCHACSPVKQWCDHYKNFLPILNVTRYDGTLEKVSDVVVTTVQALALYKSRSKHDPKVFNEWLATFGCVIFDEIHAYGSRENSIVFDLVFPRYILGLSATPERIDWMEKMYGEKVGPIIYTSEKLGIEPPKFNGQVRLVDPSLPTQHLGNGETAEVVKSITLDKDRVDALVKILRFQFEEDPSVNIILMCNYIEEADFLFISLISVFSNRVIKLAYKDMDPEEVAESADLASILIGTYSKIGTGFSSSKFTSMHIWSPTRRRHKQAVGRVCRWKDGDDESNKKLRVVYDWIDRCTICATQYYGSSFMNNKDVPGRRSTYLGLEWGIITPKMTEATTAKAIDSQKKFFEACGFSTD
jgi:hypothetical protein